MRVFIIAGEPSGDRLGAALMEGLKEIGPELRFDGIGGPLMQAEGLESRFPMEELSVMGIAEILPKYRALMKRINETASQIVESAPDVLITIDSPDFSLRVAKRVKAVSDIRTVHYVAPTVWAWRAGRAEKMARVIDHVLALFPFEPDYMTAAGMECDFVGHPVTAEARASEEDALAFRADQGIGDAPMILVLPGSRRGEVARLSEVFGESLKRFVAEVPHARVVIPTLAHIEPMVRELVRGWPGAPVVLNPRHAEAKAQKAAAFKAADIALAASGTVSLELAAARTPMVIAYDMAFLTRQIIKRMLKVDTVTLVNLVSGQKVVPEFIFEDCTAEQISAGMLEVYAQPEAQMEAMALSMERLGEGAEPAGLRAARAVLDGMARAKG